MKATDEEQTKLRPAEPDATLQRQQFRTAMKEGDEAWAFYEREGFADAIQVALASYAKAYDIHPRNREAVATLNRAADEALRVTKDDPARRHEMANNLQLLSAHFRKYAPVVDAAR